MKMYDNHMEFILMCICFPKKSQKYIRAQSYKPLFMLNSAENEICSAYKK